MVNRGGIKMQRSVRVEKSVFFISQTKKNKRREVRLIKICNLPPRMARTTDTILVLQGLQSKGYFLSRNLGVWERDFER